MRWCLICLCMTVGCGVGELEDGDEGNRVVNGNGCEEDCEKPAAYCDDYLPKFLYGTVYAPNGETGQSAALGVAPGPFQLVFRSTDCCRLVESETTSDYGSYVIELPTGRQWEIEIVGYGTYPDKVFSECDSKLMYIRLERVSGNPNTPPPSPSPGDPPPSPPPGDPPPNGPGPMSCENRCGTQAPGGCSCEYLCVLDGTCCSDMWSACIS